MDINYKELFEKSSIENIKLKDEIKKYTEEINQLKEHLKKYTAPKRNKTYYENHKDKIKEKFDWMFNRITFDKAKKISRPMYQKAIKKLENL